MLDCPSPKKSTSNGCDSVRSYILTKFRSGDKLPKARDLSKMAGVSCYAVERVLTEMSAEGIVERKPKYGSVLLGNRKRPKPTTKVKTIAFMADNLRSFIASELLLGIESRGREKNFLISPLNSNYQAEIEEQHIENLIDNGFCGAIIRFGEQSENIKKLKEIPKGFPVVLVDRGDDDNEYPCVRMAQENAGYDATRHLIELGHRKIAHITYNENGHNLLSETLERKEGFYRALNEEKIGVPPGYLQGGELFDIGENPTRSYFNSLGYEPMNRLLLQKERPTAVFLMHFQFVFGVLRAVKDHGLKIPEDISIICIDNEPLSLHLDPPITVISQPLQDIGALAVNILGDILEGKEIAQSRYELKGRLIQRGSTAMAKK